MTLPDSKAFGKKLAQLRKAGGFSQIDVARHISSECGDITNRAVSKWENGDSLPDARQFVHLCNFLGIDDVISVFLGIDSGNPFGGLNKLGRERANEYIAMLRQNNEYSKVPKQRKLRRIPLYDLPASAGTGVFLDGDNYSIIEVDESIPDDATFAVRLSGDSMQPRFKNGQVVYVHQQPALDNGDIGIFLLNGEAYCKKLDISSGLKLISLNSRYQPIKVKYAYELRIVGKVLC